MEPMAMDSAVASITVSEPRVLVLGHEPLVSARIAGRMRELNCRVETCAHADEALRILQERPKEFDLLVSRLEMPELGGIELLRLLQQSLELRQIPVILLITGEEPSVLREAMAAGALFLLHEKDEENALQPILHSALAEGERLRRFHRTLVENAIGFKMLQEGVCSVHTIEDAETLACFLAGSFNDRESVAKGIFELILNAIEHGNLEIGFAAKANMLAAGNWQESVRDLLDSPFYRDRRVTVKFRKTPEGLHLTIADNGPGFDWKLYVQGNPTLNDKPNGRGIAFANLVCFDQLKYNDAGNQVDVFVSNARNIAW